MSASMKSVVVSQPMYFPWLGLFNQIRLCDVFVHYDDVQYARGFYNRVQVKTPQGQCWITVPLAGKRRGQKLNESKVSYEADWTSQHRKTLINSYKKTKFIDDAISIFDVVTQRRPIILSELGINSVMVVARYLGLDEGRHFYRSSDLGLPGSGSQRLLDIATTMDASVYLTGHGALSYLNHDLFESHKVEVRYLSYHFTKYPQVFGAFTPYVTILDAVAHLGPSAADVLQSTTLNWKDASGRSGRLRP